MQEYIKTLETQIEVLRADATLAKEKEQVLLSEKKAAKQTLATEKKEAVAQAKADKAKIKDELEAEKAAAVAIEQWQKSTYPQSRLEKLKTVYGLNGMTLITTEAANITVLRDRIKLQQGDAANKVAKAMDNYLAILDKMSDLNLTLHAHDYNLAHLERSYKMTRIEEHKNNVANRIIETQAKIVATKNAISNLTLLNDVVNPIKKPTTVEEPKVEPPKIKEATIEQSTSGHEPASAKTVNKAKSVDTRAPKTRLTQLKPNLGWVTPEDATGIMMLRDNLFKQSKHDGLKLTKAQETELIKQLRMLCITRVNPDSARQLKPVDST